MEMSETNRIRNNYNLLKQEIEKAKTQLEKLKKEN